MVIAEIGKKQDNMFSYDTSPLMNLWDVTHAFSDANIDLMAIRICQCNEMLRYPFPSSEICFCYVLKYSFSVWNGMCG